MKITREFGENNGFIFYYFKITIVENCDCTRIDLNQTASKVGESVRPMRTVKNERGNVAFFVNLKIMYKFFIKK